MRSWTEWEYNRLFRDRRPTEASAPGRDEVSELAHELSRSPGAIAAQWNDARSAVLRNKSAASHGLVAYLKRKGWLA